MGRCDVDVTYDCVVGGNCVVCKGLRVVERGPLKKVKKTNLKQVTF